MSLSTSSFSLGVIVMKNCLGLLCSDESEMGTKAMSYSVVCSHVWASSHCDAECSETAI